MPPVDQQRSTNRLAAAVAILMLAAAALPVVGASLKDQPPVAKAATR